jgi:hypothetical protein
MEAGVNMSHVNVKNAYRSLEERINKFPQGAPPSKTLYSILSILFTEKEAELVAQLPIKPFRVKTAAKIWSMSYSEALKILDTLAGKAILFTLFTLLCGLGWLVYCILFHCILVIKYAAKIFIYIFQKKERK